MILYPTAQTDTKITPSSIRRDYERWRKEQGTAPKDSITIPDLDYESGPGYYVGQDTAIDTRRPDPDLDSNRWGPRSWVESQQREFGDIMNVINEQTPLKPIMGTLGNMADQLQRIWSLPTNMVLDPKRLGKKDYWQNEFLVPGEEQRYRYKHGIGTDPGEDTLNTAWGLIDAVGAAPISMGSKTAAAYSKAAYKWGKPYINKAWNYVEPYVKPYLDDAADVIRSGENYIFPANANKDLIRGSGAGSTYYGGKALSDDEQDPLEY